MASFLFGKSDKSAFLHCKIHNFLYAKIWKHFLQMDLKADEKVTFIALDSISQIMMELDELSSEIQHMIQNIHLLLMKKFEFGDTLATILIAIGYLVERIELNLAKIRRFMFEFTRVLYRVMTVMHRNLIAEHISLTRVMSDIYEDTKELNEARNRTMKNERTG